MKRELETLLNIASSHYLLISSSPHDCVPSSVPEAYAHRLTYIVRCVLLTALTISVPQSLAFAQAPKDRDPAAWGSDHVGKTLPQFTSGDECLFCHRMDVGPTWATNRHGQTVRAADPQAVELLALKQAPQLADLAADIEWILGGSNRLRFLKRGTGHGRLDLLSVEWAPAEPGANGQLVASEKPHWNGQRFGVRCAGCHASGVNSSQRTFTALSLDCFVCHGDVPEKHTTNPSLVYLSPQRTDPAPLVTSICAQCHLRSGTSRSTGLPYANQFVAGDNLFRDFRVDLTDTTVQKLNPGDRHVQENVRDVVLLDRDGVTCLSCHDVHSQSSKKHHLVADSNLCRNCHAKGTKKNRIRYEVHSPTCGY